MSENGTPEVTPSQPSAPLTAPAESLTEEAVATGDQSAFKEARLAEKEARLAPKADSRSATQARPAAPTGALSKVASEAANTPTPPRGNAKTRIAEVDQEITTLKAKLAERDGLLARQREAPAAETPPEKPSGLALPADLATYEAYLAKNPRASLEEYFDARSDARQAVKAQQHEQARRQVEREQETAAQVSAFTKKVNDAAEADATFTSRVSPVILGLRPIISLQPGERPGPGNVLAQELLTSEAPDKVMEALTADPDLFAKLMSARHPREIVRGLAKIEAQVTSGQPAAPPTFKQSTAPTPPTTLGRRPTDTMAPTDAAVRDGDQAAYKAARNEERALRFGGRNNR